MISRDSADPTPPESLLLGASLFLDLDGTFVPIADRPDEVRIDERRRVLLDRLLRRMPGRVAIVSGRSAGEIARLIGMPLTIAGSHGVELSWVDGRRIAPAPPASLAEIGHELQVLRSSYPGVLIEEKPFGVALHYRQCPQAENACRLLAESLSETPGMSLQAGKMVFEIRYGNRDKGDAIRAFMSESPMAATRPIFLGDDLTDEPAFRAATELGGTGILVGPPRATAARFRLETVTDALEWLERAADQRS